MSINKILPTSFKMVNFRNDSVVIAGVEMAMQTAYHACGGRYALVVNQSRKYYFLHFLHTATVELKPCPYLVWTAHISDPLAIFGKGQIWTKIVHILRKICPYFVKKMWTEYIL